MTDMSTYLDNVTADYTATELTIAPQKELREMGQKVQVIHKNDDGTMDVVTLAGSYFDVTFEWSWLSDSDAEILEAFWDDATKGDAKAQTFYWYHPGDENTYTAQFLSDLTLVDEYRKIGAKEVPPVTLRIVGNKP